MKKSKLSLLFLSSLALITGVASTGVAGVLANQSNVSVVKADDASIDLSQGTYSGTGTTGQIVWDSTYATITQTKGTSSTSVSSSYVSAPRWYQNHVISFAAKDGFTLAGAVITCTTNAYATALKNSTYSTGASATSSSSTVTITSTGNFTITMGAQSRISTIVLTYNSASADPSKVSNVTLNSGSELLDIGDTFQLTATVLPSTATNKNVTWASIDPTIATVDQNGLVTAVKGGETTIKVTTSDGNKVASCAIKVVQYPTLVGVEVGKSYSIIGKASGTSYQLTTIVSKTGTAVSLTGAVDEEYAYEIVQGLYKNTVAFKMGGSYIAYQAGKTSNDVFTSDTIDAYSSWTVSVSSKDSSLYTVTNVGDSERLLQFNLNASATNGSPKFSCYTIKSNMTDVSFVEKGLDISASDFELNVSELRLGTGQTYSVGTTFTPSNATDQILTWSTSNDSVATVSSSGVITAVSAGTATITASKTINGENVERTIALTVFSLGTSESPLSVSEAADIIGTNTETSSAVMYVSGVVSSVSKKTDASTGKTTYTLYLKDDIDDTLELEVYKGVLSADISDEIEVGDTVVCSGKYAYYSSGSIPELTSSPSILSLEKGSYTDPNNYGTEDSPLTVEEARALCGSNYTNEQVYVYGQIVGDVVYNSTYKNYEFSIASSAESTDVLTVYRATVPSTKTIAEGDIVIVSGYAKLYNDVYELYTNNDVNPQVLSGYRDTLKSSWQSGVCEEGEDIKNAARLVGSVAEEKVTDGLTEIGFDITVTKTGNSPVALSRKSVLKLYSTIDDSTNHVEFGDDAVYTSENGYLSFGFIISEISWEFEGTIVFTPYIVFNEEKILCATTTITISDGVLA